MQEDIIFQRRNRLKKHFVNTSNVLLYGYQKVSDASKITYQVIDGFDWESRETGDSKGFVFPAVDTLARIRNTSARTIQRHIKELEGVGLLTRQRRRNKPSILFIEEVADGEVKKYLENFVDKPKREGESIKSRNDKNVVSQTTAETTKMSFAYRKEEELLKENKINVNENKHLRGNGVDALSNILMHYKLKRPKNLKKPEEILKRDYLADEIAEKLNDKNSLGCFRVIAEKIPQNVIFEVLSSVKETANAGKIRESKGALFVEIIKKYAEGRGIDLGFKQD